MQVRKSFALGAATVVLIAACAATDRQQQRRRSATGNASGHAGARLRRRPQRRRRRPTAWRPRATARALAAEASATPEHRHLQSDPDTRARSVAPSGWTVGVVTDVGTIDDKNFNQYSYEGAKLGAHSIGAPDPGLRRPGQRDRLRPDIQNFVDQGANIIVTVGFNLTPDTLAAQGEPERLVRRGRPERVRRRERRQRHDVHLRRRRQRRCCRTSSVSSTRKTRLATSRASWPAASARTRTWRPSVASTWCLRSCATSRAYELGAKSVDKKIKVDTGYVSTSDFTIAFNNPGEGKNFADQFIATNHPDVVFQVAGKTGNGVLESACTQRPDRHRRRRRPVAVAERCNRSDLWLHRHLGGEAPVCFSLATIQQIFLQQPLGLDAVRRAALQRGEQRHRRLAGAGRQGPDHALTSRRCSTPRSQAWRTGHSMTCPENCGSAQ